MVNIDIDTVMWFLSQRKLQTRTGAFYLVWR